MRLKKRTRTTARAHPRAALDKQKPVLALIDGDLLAYHVTTSLLEEKYNRNTDEYSYTLPFDLVKNETRVRIEALQALLNADAVQIAFTGAANFRKRLYPAYKAHRKNRKPLGYAALLEWMHYCYVCDTEDMLEADDLLGMWATDPVILAKYCPVIVSDDKDMRTIPGYHFPLSRMGESKGHVQQVTEGQAFSFWMTQTLAGDSTDGYPGVPGIGPKKAADVIALGNGRKAPVWLAVVDAFEAAGKTEADAVTQARMARILQHGEYDFNTGEVTLWDPKQIGAMR